MSVDATTQAYRNLLAENQRLQAQVTLLSHVLHLFSAPDDFDVVFDGLLDATVEYFHAHSGALYMYDANKEELYFAAARGPKAREVLALDKAIKPGQGIAGNCFLHNEVIALSDAHKDARFSREISDAVGYEVRSMLTAPLVCDGQPLGAIQVLNKKNGSVFTAEEVEMARRLGVFAGGLIGLGWELQALKQHQLQDGGR